jgi:hypothetical protein
MEKYTSELANGDEAGSGLPEQSNWRILGKTGPPAFRPTEPLAGNETALAHTSSGASQDEPSPHLLASGDSRQEMGGVTTELASEATSDDVLPQAPPAALDAQAVGAGEAPKKLDRRITIGRAIGTALLTGTALLAEETPIGLEHMPTSVMAHSIGHGQHSPDPKVAATYQKLGGLDVGNTGLQQAHEYSLWFGNEWPHEARNSAYFAGILLAAVHKQDLRQFLIGVDASGRYGNTRDGKLPAVTPYFAPLGLGHFDRINPREKGVWTDDNGWRGLNAMKAWKLGQMPANLSFDQQVAWLANGYQLPGIENETGNAENLQEAKDAFAFAVSQWDDENGGIRWIAKEGDTRRPENTKHVLVSNAPIATLGVQLYKETGDEQYLQWAERIHGWVQNTLYDKATGLYNDSISEDGAIDRSKYTYNQIAMAKLKAELHSVKPEQYSLVDAVNIIDTSYDYFGGSQYGYAESAEFNAKLFAGVLYLLSQLAQETSLDKPDEAPGGARTPDELVTYMLARTQNALDKSLAQTAKKRPANIPNIILYDAGEAQTRALQREAKLAQQGKLPLAAFTIYQ